MEQKTIIITGASSGLGAAAAKLTAEFGATAVLSARSVEALSKLADEIKAQGGRAVIAPGDVSQAADCQAIIDTAVSQTGRIDGLINNAGVLEPLTTLADIDAQEMQRALSVNLIGPIMLTQAALPHLRENQGRVINVSSGAAVKNYTGWAAYCISKAALNHFNRQLAHEEKAITAIALRPGVVDTPMQQLIREKGQEAMSADNHARFIAFFEEGQLLPPEKPGRSLAKLALLAPHAWSAQFLQWDEQKVLELGIDN